MHEREFEIGLAVLGVKWSGGAFLEGAEFWDILRIGEV